MRINARPGSFKDIRNDSHSGFFGVVRKVDSSCFSRNFLYLYKVHSSVSWMKPKLISLCWSENCILFRNRLQNWSWSASWDLNV